MSRRYGARLVGVAMLATAAACSPQRAQVDLPPVAPPGSDDRHVGKFVWHDLITDDVAAAKAFYGALLGWEFEDLQGEGVTYTLVRSEGEPVGGMAAVAPVDSDLAGARWLSLMSVEDVDAAVDIVEERGGRAIAEPWTNPTRGRMAVVADSQGAIVAFITSIAGDPRDRTAEQVPPGQWLWTELWTRDAAAAANVYGAVAGYGVELTTIADNNAYRVLMRDGTPRAGLNELPWPEVEPNWLPYIKVANAADVARRAEQLGGTVLIPPMERIRNGSLGLVLDPTGAAFAIQSWPIPDNGDVDVPGIGGAR